MSGTPDVTEAEVETTSDRKCDGQGRVGAWFVLDPDDYVREGRPKFVSRPPQAPQLQCEQTSSGQAEC